MEKTEKLLLQICLGHWIFEFGIHLKFGACNLGFNNRANEHRVNVNAEHLDSRR